MRTCLKCKSDIQGIAVMLFVDGKPLSADVKETHVLCTNCGANGHNSITDQEYQQLTDPHANCNPGANAYKMVKCDGCGREYQCTPYDDHYCAGFDANHYCESCLIQRGVKAYNDACVERDRHLHGAILVETITPDGQTVDTRMQEL